MDSDLLIRETILGVIKSRDLNNEGIIHTSDFRSAVADLGFPFGHPLIENILVHCVINSEGFVDFTGLERELARERRVLNAKISATPAQRTVKTSSGVPLKPWRADVVHHQKMQSERQAKLLQEKHNDVFEAFRKYEEQQHSEEELIHCIKSLGVVPTRSFLELLRTNRSCEISFGDFMRSLIHYDPNSKPLDYDQPAGGSASLMGRNDSKDREEHQAGLFYARKRMDFQKKSAMQSSQMDEKKTGKRFAHVVIPGSVGTKGSTPGSQSSAKALQFKGSSTGVQSILSGYEPQGTLLMSTAHLQMHKGKAGNLPTNQSELSYTSEQKLLREQVLAALRKLDAGEISVVEFLDIIFAMGIELPEGVLKQLKLQQQSGLLDWRACVHELDGYVFKHRSLEDNTPHEMVALAMQKLKTALSGQGPLDSLSKLLFFFNSADENGDKHLSYNEFRKACRDFLSDVGSSDGRGVNIVLSDSDIRHLFNHFDKSGDGFLSYDEVVKTLQGDISPRRRDIIHQAFVLMDVSGAGEISLARFLEHFNVNYYPDVVAGTKTAWKALRDIEDFFQACSTSGLGMESMISAENFEVFFSNISPGIEIDDDFFSAVRSMTGLSNKKPAVQNRHMSSGDTQRIPLAKQSFGDLITWGEEKSHLESISVSRSRQKKTVVPNFPRHPNIISNQEKKGETYAPPDTIDGINLSRTNKGTGTKNLLAWATPIKRLSETPVPVSRRRDAGPEETDMFLMKGYQWSDSKKAQYGGTCPYGIDEDSKKDRQQASSEGQRSKSSSKGGSANLRSLADIMASRGG